jgi:hypothetical protein
MNNPMSLAAGILAQKNLPVAEVLTRILYVFWFIHCGGLSITVSFSGIRLIRILNGHLEKFNTSGPRYASVKTGIFKIRTIMGISIICLSGFAVFLLVFGILREIIIVNKVGSIVLGVLWNFLGAVSTFCCELAILFK